ncbi:hypothetical protein AMR42_11235 [Limnothrix sp. PR1529]|nr:hypothetical protein BCR12_17600 [Limnothrix sp. P13C2]PIB09982.1 hypothetical protein AMR42_11235 [Limnothrix sp. PR1529]
MYESSLLGLLKGKSRDGFVNFLHQLDSFLQGYDDALVMGNVFWAESATFAVFEPFLTDLVATYIKTPDFFRYGRKAITFFVNHNFSLYILGMSGINNRVEITLKFSDKCIKFGRLHQVQGYQLFTVGREFLEKIKVAGEGDTGEIDFQKFGVAVAIGGRVKNGVYVVKDGFGGGGGIEFSCEVFEKFRGKVDATVLSDFSAIGIEIEGSAISIISRR